MPNPLQLYADKIALGVESCWGEVQSKIPDPYGFVLYTVDDAVGVIGAAASVSDLEITEEKWDYTDWRLTGLGMGHFILPDDFIGEYALPELLAVMTYGLNQMRMRRIIADEVGLFVSVVDSWYSESIEINSAKRLNSQEFAIEFEREHPFKLFREKKEKATGKKLIGDKMIDRINEVAGRYDELCAVLGL